MMSASQRLPQRSRRRGVWCGQQRGRHDATPSGDLREKLWGNVQRGAQSKPGQLKAAIANAGGSKQARDGTHRQLRAVAADRIGQMGAG